MQKLIDETRGLEGRSKDVKVLSENVIRYLRDVSEAPIPDVEEAVNNLSKKYTG